MSNIGFMRNTALQIEALFNFYMNNKKRYPSQAEKEQYRDLIFQFERLYRFGEIEDEKEYKVLIKKIRNCDLTSVVEKRKK